MTTPINVWKIQQFFEKIGFIHKRLCYIGLNTPLLR